MVKAGLHCQIYSKFFPHFMCWKYLDECFIDNRLLHIFLTKFNKLNKRRKWTFLITQFIFALYSALIFSTFSVYLWHVVWSTPVSEQFFWLEVKKMCCELMCWVAKNNVFYMITFIFDVVRLIFCVTAE